MRPWPYIADKKNELVLAGNAVSATGVVAADVSAGGKLEILNSGAITNNKNVADTAITAITRPKTGVVSSTGLSLTGAVTVKAGNISVSQTGSVAGITAATGIAMISASGTGVAAVNKSVTVDSGTADVTNIGAVTSLVLISETGSVTSDSAIGKSIGIVATGNVTATIGKVEINQSGGVHGGVSATGISVGTITGSGKTTKVTGVSSTGVGYSKVTNVVATKTQLGAATPTINNVTTVTTTEAVLGELKLNQSDAVEAGAGNATGIVGTTLTGTLALGESVANWCCDGDGRCGDRD